MQTDDAGRQKNSSMFTGCSQEVQLIADKVVDEELSENHNTQTKKEYFLHIGSQLEIDGVPKKQISKLTLQIIEERLALKLQEEGIPPEQAKLSVSTVRHLSRTMQQAGYTDPFFARNKKEDDDQKDILAKEYPEGIEFEILHLWQQISKNNQLNLEKMYEKIVFNPYAINKQKKDKTDTERHERLEQAKTLIDTRRKKVKSHIQKLNRGNLESLKGNLQKIISDQKKIAMYFDGRMSLTMYQKAMAMIAINIGYDKSDIARFLNVTAKHIKLNIYSDEAKKELLQYLEWTDRCPNPKCGIRLVEFLHSLEDQWREGRSISYEDYDVEPLLATGYQNENRKLQKEVKKLKQKLDRAANKTLR